MATSKADVELKSRLSNMPSHFTLISPDEVVSAIKTRIKSDKSPDIYTCRGELFLMAADELAQPLSNLFSHLLDKGFWPDSLACSIFFPVLKDNTGSAARSSNYRGIAIEPMISRIYEAIFKARYKTCLQTNVQEFAYKKGKSCSTCTYNLLDIVEYYATQNSSLQLLFLDASKAFDKLIPSTLCSKLLDRGVPAAEVKLLFEFLTSAYGVVKFGCARSSRFKLQVGVRQGSLLGGLLWTIYVDSLLSELQLSGLGCHMNGIWSGAFIHADDICLLSSTTAGLRNMMQITEKFAAEHQVKLNPTKSKLIVCGSVKRLNLGTLMFNGEVIEPVTSVRYLGFELVVSRTGAISVASNFALRKFYCSANVIFAIPGCTKPLVRLRLVKAMALPHVDYVLSLWRFMAPTAKQVLNSAVNRVLRRSLGLHHTCSGDLVCCSAAVTPVSIRAGHLSVSLASSPSLGSNTLEVLRLRSTGMKGKLAALTVAKKNISHEHAERARCIRALLRTSDTYSRRMAYNISVPSVLIC